MSVPAWAMPIVVRDSFGQIIPKLHLYACQHCPVEHTHPIAEQDLTTYVHHAACLVPLAAAAAAAKCHTVSCSEPWDCAVYWPGQPTRLCRACTRRAAGIAQVMGFDLSIVTLHPESAHPPDDPPDAEHLPGELPK